MTAWRSVLHPRRQAAAVADLQAQVLDQLLTIRQLTSQVEAKEARVQLLLRPVVRVRVAVHGHNVLDTGYVHPQTSWQGALNGAGVPAGFLSLTWRPEEPKADQR